MKVPLILVSDPRDVFYYSGYEAGTDDHPMLLVRKTGKPALFLSPLTEGVKAYADIRFFKKLNDLLKSLPKKIGIDDHHLPAHLFLKIKKKRRLVPSAEIIKKPREVKDEEEIELMKKAIRINKRALESIQLFGKTEKLLAEEIEKEFYLKNATPAFETIVATGSNSGNYIHHFPGRRIVRRKDMTIIDFGCRWKGYCSDITRTYFNKRDKKQREMFEMVQHLQRECLDLVKPGVDFHAINNFYKKFLKEKGFAVRHGIGHGIGIFVHEPFKKLEKGMVITIEPGMYLKNFGGCRLEDMVLVKKKPLLLSSSIPLWGFQ